MTTNAGKRRRQAARAAQGYEDRPPRCLNCRNYSTPEHAVPLRKPYVPATCGIGGFLVRPYSICDRWVGIDGDTLEQPEAGSAPTTTIPAGATPR